MIVNQRPSRICPDCNNSDLGKGFREDELGVWCLGCGVRLSDPALPDREVGYEEETKSAAKRIDFHGGVGRGLGREEIRDLMKKGVIGIYCSKCGAPYAKTKQGNNHWQPSCRCVENSVLSLDARYNELSKVLRGGDNGLHTALQHASDILKELGLDKTPLTSGQESRYSDIVGDEVGWRIRRFYAFAKEGLRALGLVNDGVEGNIAPFSVQHRVVAECVTACILVREAQLNNDERRWMRAKGFRWNPNVKQWEYDPKGPKLSFTDPKLMELVGRIAF